MIDAFGNLDLDSLISGGLRKRQGPMIPPMDPAQASSLLGKIGGAGLSGLGYIAGSLNKPGRAVRGLLSGRPEELANLIPFSDTLGITDESKQVTGRGLLEQYGVLGPNTQGFDWGDVAGFAADVLTDPLTGASLGPRAINAGAQAAAQAGKLPLVGTLNAAGKTVYPSSRALAEEALQKGLLAPTYGSRIEAGQGGLFGLGLPFQKPSMVFGTGKTAQKFAENVLDPLGMAIGQSAPVRGMKRLFDGTVGNMATAIGQQVFRKTAEATRNTAQEVAQQAQPWLRQFEQAGLAGDPVYERALRASGIVDPALLQGLDVAGIKALAAANPAVASIFPRVPGTAERLIPDAVESAKLQQALTIGEDYRKLFPEALEKQQRAGVGNRAVEDVYEPFMPRQSDLDMDRTWTNIGAGFGRPAGTDFRQAGRNPGITNVPYGSNAVDDLVQDPRLAIPLVQPVQQAGEAADIFAKRAAQELRQQRGARSEILAKDYWGEQGGMKGLRQGYKSDIDRLRSTAQNLTEQAKYIIDPKLKQQFLDQAKAAKGELKTLRAAAPARQIPRTQRFLEQFEKPLTGPMFNVPSMEAGSRYLKRANQFTNAAEGMTEVVARTALPLAEAAHDSVPLDQFFKQMAQRNVRGDFPEFKLLGDERGAINRTLEKIKEIRGVGVDPKNLKQFAIPKEYADDIVRGMKAYAVPDEVGPVVAAADKLMSWFKKGVYSLIPASWGRNLMSGTTQAIMSGTANPAAMAKAIWHDAPAALTGRLKDSGVAGRTMSQIYDEFAPLMESSLGIGELGLQQQSLGTIKAGAKGVTASPGAIGPATRRTTPFPGKPTAPPVTAPTITADVTDKSLIEFFTGKANPKLAETTAGKIMEGLSEVGRRAGNIGKAGEEMVRFGHYLTARRAGKTAPEAAAEVLKYHFDYASRSPFEKSVVQRLIPFWTFQKNITPFVAKELAQSPGGVYAQAIKATEQGVGQDEFVPGYLKEQGAIPVGGEVDGKRRFITSLGLPWESAFSPIRTFQGAPDIQRSMETALSMARPELRIPLEELSNRSFYFGREKDKVQSLTGNTITDDIVMGSPLSRVATSGRRLMDPNKEWFLKPLDFLTGIKVSDVNLNQARRDADVQLDRILANSPNVQEFERYYTPKSQVANMTPEERELMALYSRRLLEKQAEAKARKGP